MNTLIIMRHAKAERGEGKPDFDRTLEQRGWTEGDIVGGRLAALGLSPDTIVCSSSRRTRDTLAAVLPHLPADCVVHLTRSLYDAGVPALERAIADADGDTVMLIGHNPSCHDLVQRLARGSRRADEVADGFATSSAAVFSVSGERTTLEELVTHGR